MADENTAVIEAPAATQAAPVTEPPKTTEKPKDVTLEKAIEEFGDTFTYGLGKKKKESAPTPEQKAKEGNNSKKENKEPAKDANNGSAEDGDKADEKLNKVDEKLHKPKTKAKPVQRQELDETRLAEIAAEAGGRAASVAVTQIENERKKSEQKRDEGFTPPSEYADQYATFQAMAKSSPGKYGGLPDAFKKFVTEEGDYIKSWKSEHPEEEWDGDAKEHNAFYARATPSYEYSDFRKAEISLELADARKELRKEVLEELDPRLKKLDEMERNETVRALQPTVAEAERAAMGGILKAIDPAYDKFTEPAELAKLKDEDPVAYDIALEVGRDAVPFVAEVTRLWKSKGAIKADQTNPLHNYINSYATKMGELIKTLPADEQVRDGKKFATWNEFSQLNANQQAKHWTLSDQDLIERKLLDAQEIAKERVDQENKKLTAWAKRKGLAQGNAQDSQPKAAAAKPEPPAKPLPAKENNGSPSVGSRTQVSPNNEPSPSSTPDYLNQFASVFNGRSL